MLSNLGRLLAPPDLKDGELDRRARLLNIILLVLIGFTLLIIMSGLLISEPLALVLGALTIAGNYAAMLLEAGPGLLIGGTPLPLTTHWAIQSGYLLLSIGLMILI